ncbi:MAG TPA: 23S rRNA (adenine(2503)-C(2))-methyltransferase RlmN [Candidatus Paceibacterota bacterium]|nr:23S rRNA (adenine(2503)-C(2))-methyltransferase RlmN [Candidatus Pacearchaeota archaeon]HRZ50751.1 23S rRNA (adenine(2503)-C(2))-methyltransferase RlmN [Candidatus Paceibacterota bacterium]HSA36352.1 23S rRNA (adenine(2503)-C(2))-methyltransferase RlmN [Candidatus Paceibacterota bacterium]
MDINLLKEALKGEPAYRFKQAKDLVFKQLIEDWSVAQGLPAGLREKLKKEIPLAIAAEAVSSESKDADKAVIVLADGVRIETVLMRHKDGRNTVCVSSQAGCPMGCVFCATGKSGFKRNLTVSEIVLQLLFFARRLKITNERIDNVVFMGMGEPFLNYDAVMEAVRLINSKSGFNIGARHISISTVGVVEGIEKLAKEPIQVNLAISLHASNDALRSRIVSANNKYPIGDILWAVYAYAKKTNRRVMFEYIMIDGVNDSDDDARALAALIKKRFSLKLAFINLITYNPTGEFKPSSRERVRKFKEIIDRENVETTERHRFGREIKAACGQLAYGSSNNKKMKNN